MPWYDGLSMEEVDAKVRSGEAPGSRVPGGIVEVPDGYCSWSSRKLTREATQLADAQSAAYAEKWTRDFIAQVVEPAVLAERERCAKVCEEMAAGADIKIALEDDRAAKAETSGMSQFHADIAEEWRIRELCFRRAAEAIRCQKTRQDASLQPISEEPA